MTGSTEGTWFLPEGRPRPKPGEEPATRVTMASEGYFRTLGIPLLSGRDFDEHDDASQPIRVIVNETMARKYWPDGSSVGRRIKMGDLNSDVWYEIVGVVGDVRTEGLDAPVPPRVYASFRQAPDTRMSLVLATSRPLDPVVDGVRRELAAIDPEVPAYGIRTVDEILEQSLGRNRLVVLVVGSFTLMALVLSVLGLYGVMAANVASRTRELGVRVALGSTGRGLAWLVLRRALILALAGVVGGGAVALALGRLLSSLLFEVQSGDPGIFALATLLLFAMALLGSASAARRAIAIDPITALQSE
jgi:predicted permease